MTVHAIRTGSVRIKTAQLVAPHPGPLGIVGVLADRDWSGWLPTYAFAIEHRDGVIVVDTGQATALIAEVRRSLHPFLRTCAQFEMTEDEEIGPQLKALGIAARDVTQVVLTHMHIDHDAGLAHFPRSRIRAAAGEVAAASGWLGTLRGYLPGRWPDWLSPEPLQFDGPAVGPFAASATLTADGSVRVVQTPGHTADHVSVILEDGAETLFLAGDASYSEDALLRGEIDGISPNAGRTAATLARIRQLAADRPLIYLPTHDPDTGDRLARRRIVPLFERSKVDAA